jgi:hypothetical protein
MTYIRNLGVELRQFSRNKRSVNNAILMMAIAMFSITASAQADPPKKVAEFAHKYIPVYNDTDAVRPLMVIARSFTDLIETQSNAVLGSTQPDLIGGIHQATKAVTVDKAAGLPIRLEYCREGRTVLWVGRQSMVTGLVAAQARPMALFVEEGYNGLATLTERVSYIGKRGYRPQLAASYVDTDQGFWLLWADAIAENLFFRTGFGIDDFPDGLTITDPDNPVTIASASDEKLKVRGGEPRVAFWKLQKRGEPGRIVRYVDFASVIEPRNQEDVRAVETVQRVFKWVPVMRLACESDPAAFRLFVRQLTQAPVATVTTPRLLMEE